MRYASWIVAILLALATPALANWDDPNISEAKEYRLFKFYPQSSVRAYEEKDFDSEKLLTTYVKGDPDKPTFEDIEGRVIRYESDHKPSTSLLEIVRQYDNLMKAKGFQIIVSGKGASFPALNLTQDQIVGYYRLDEPDGNTVWVHLDAYYESGDVAHSKIAIVETKPMEQKLEGNAGAMMQALQSTGHVAVYGINFDFGKATIRPESVAVLAGVLSLLSADLNLRLMIEGHTDNVGQSGLNQKLSADRAASVKVWLVTNGIDAARLQTAGFGDTRPVADNHIDEGRAKNRRVELAKQ